MFWIIQHWPQILTVTFNSNPSNHNITLMTPSAAVNSNSSTLNPKPHQRQMSATVIFEERREISGRGAWQVSGHALGLPSSRVRSVVTMTMSTDRSRRHGGWRRRLRTLLDRWLIAAAIASLATWTSNFQHRSCNVTELQRSRLHRQNESKRSGSRRCYLGNSSARQHRSVYHFCCII